MFAVELWGRRSVDVEMQTRVVFGVDVELHWDLEGFDFVVVADFHYWHQPVVDNQLIVPPFVGSRLLVGWGGVFVSVASRTLSSSSFSSLVVRQRLYANMDRRFRTARRRTLHCSARVRLPQTCNEAVLHGNTDNRT